MPTSSSPTSDSAIVASGLGKRYRIGRMRTHHETLSETISTAVRHPIAATRRALSREPSPTMWALKDVSFEVKPGEIVGIIGRNGAGKSTLLKLLSRITEPTEGFAELHGRIGALLEVGTGFHPELTGRENTFLNGAVLGMKRAEIARKFDEIVAFADIGEFLDTPVKRYSSGMYVRLAFAVAAHLEPDILIVDEVLAVGDAEFQRKCLGKMEHVAGHGRTVLFVSHNMGAVEGLCPRAIWLNKGRIQADGPSGEVVRKYLDSGSDAAVYEPEGHLGFTDLVIEKLMLRNARGEATTAVAPGEQLRVEIHYRALQRLPRPSFWLTLGSRFGWLFGSNMMLDGAQPEFIEGPGVITCEFSAVRLLPGTYSMRLGVRREDGLTNYIPTNIELGFSVTGSARDYGFHGELANTMVGEAAPLLVPYRWHLPDGRVVAVEGVPVEGEPAANRR